MLQIPWKIKSSNSKMLQIPLINGSFQLQNAVNSTNLLQYHRKWEVRTMLQMPLKWQLPAHSSCKMLQTARNMDRTWNSPKKQNGKKKQTFPDPFRYRDVTRNLYVIGPGATGMPDAQRHCTHTQNSWNFVLHEASWGLFFFPLRLNEASAKYRSRRPRWKHGRAVGLT